MYYQEHISLRQGLLQPGQRYKLFKTECKRCGNKTAIITLSENSDSVVDINGILRQYNYSHYIPRCECCNKKIKNDQFVARLNSREEEISKMKVYNNIDFDDLINISINEDITFLEMAEEIGIDCNRFMVILQFRDYPSKDEVEKISNYINQK